MGHHCEDVSYLCVLKSIREPPSLQVVYAGYVSASDFQSIRFSTRLFAETKTAAAGP